ncbi:MAG TPA: cobalt-precorrin-5B (C(1))-methyltransferase CbiD [Anaerolineae bacterium]|nr:cobalt-precorrin-5B (C(1))-methyltransferase CbiD [Anaerolineae bacterium]
MATKKKLKTGFTTGAAAAAAAKGALLLILTGEKPCSVQIELLTGDNIIIPVFTCISQGENKAKCTVIKDAGDDPDITHKAEIGATVTLLDNGNHGSVSITGGKGVGMVTKPGLEIEPGEPAINTGPRKMITQAVAGLLKKYNKNKLVKVEIFVPEGEKLAEKTLNARLGILGGISILGTTGVERPMSHDAYVATIRLSLSVAKAFGLKSVVLTTGRRSERFAQALFENLPEEAFIQIGDFFKISLEDASKNGFKKIILAAFFGKAVKMAQGVPHTHAARSSLSMKKLSDWSFEITKKREFAEKILSANTARHAFDFIINEHPQIISCVGRKMVKAARMFAGSDIDIQGIIFDFSGDVVFDSDVMGLKQT